MSEIGHNQGPGMVETAAETTAAISAFMAENPVIETEDQAREAKLFADRGKLCIKDLKDEQDKNTLPLRESLDRLYETYRGPRELAQKVLNELQARISNYLKIEEAKRIKAAEEAKLLAEEAERLAREAEQREHDAYESADAGELGVDIAAVTQSADAAFDEYKRAERQAAVAERESKVKIGGGFGRAASLKTKETLVVVDALAVLRAIGMTDDIQEAILKGARAYRRLHGKLPAGIEIKTDRSI